MIGLSIGRALALLGRDVLILEKESTFGTATSSRNSEVIHAGIYYPQNSMKARLCVQGKLALYDYCSRMGVDHKRLGKLIVACSEAEVPTLHQLKLRAATNGVDDMELISATDVKAMEPALECHAALLSPSTGIVDSHGLMLAYLGELEARGGTLSLGSTVQKVVITDTGFEIMVGDGNQAFHLSSRFLINATGLHAPDLARSMTGYNQSLIPSSYYLKGNYFTLNGRSPFRRLIYPVPVPGGAGTHVTLDLSGQARFGPDTELVQDLNYAVDPYRGDSFYAAIRRYWPDLKDGALIPAYSGIRPKLGQIDDAYDFVIQGFYDHGVPGLVQLYGIESPGLTASLVLGEYVADLLKPF